MERDTNRTKKVHLENALSEQTLSEQAGDDFCMEQSIGQPSSAEESSNKKMVDKEIDFSRKYQDAKTQYSLSHCCQGIQKKISLKPTKIKVPTKKKTREAATNTQVSFSPHENVIMKIAVENPMKKKENPLQRCTICCSPASIEKKIIKGTMIIVDLLCKNDHRFTWRSQSLKNGMAFGNNKVSAAILFSGNTFQRIKEIVNISNVSFLYSQSLYNQ